MNPKELAVIVLAACEYDGWAAISLLREAVSEVSPAIERSLEILAELTLPEEGIQ